MSDAAVLWLVAATAFNLWWLPHLVRSKHPAAGSSQSIMTAATAVCVILLPEFGLTFGGFMLMGVVLVTLSGGRAVVDRLDVGDREWGVLGPFEFMDFIAVSGLHGELYQRVLEFSLSQLHSLHVNGSRPTVSVNMDARNLREPDLATRTLAAIELFGLLPSDLILELTEEALIGDDRMVHRTLTELNEAGVLLSIDDFGTGFSSLAYLNLLPISELKIDRSLVSQASDSSRAKAVLEAVFGLLGSTEPLFAASSTAA